ncbi:MAG: hypothetical protein RLZZ597_1337 [Cyanobacteriota bacterium]
MGFLKAIFGIIGGFFKAILGVFGLGKQSEFFMELDESTAPPEVSAQPTAATPAAPAATPTQTVAASPGPVVAPVTPVATAAPKSAQPAASVPSFAANYLVGPTMPRRRRPGPSLSPFMDMAKQVKVR